ncbi:unnamed protein product [Amaranthus hypochondriacus]
MDDKKSGSSKRDRRTVEKERRNKMKNLCSQLNSLVPHDRHTSSSRTIQDQIGDATNYIMQLQGNVENLRKTRDDLRGNGGGRGGSSGGNSNSSSSSSVQIQVNENENAVVVTLMTALECQFVFTEAVRILHEENAEVVNASYSVSENTVFHTIHAQMGEYASIERITERLRRFEL